MCNRTMLTLFFGIILVDMASAQNHVAIEQTNGYKDTWTNMSSACSLLGVELQGNTWENKVSVGNIDEITGTGWISAHVESQGTLRFVGCEYGTVRTDTPRLEIAHDRIPECIYFCGSSDILLHWNHCYCTSNVYLHNSNCVASRCGNNEPLFCGQSGIASSKCMCRYNKYLGPNIRNNFMGGSCENVKINCTLKAQYPFLRLIQTWHVICWENHVQCNFDWNGYVMNEEFYWGTSSSAIGNQDNCVAIRRVISSRTFTLITLPCSSKQTGICIRGSRISETPQATQTSMIILPTTGGYELLTSEQISDKISEHTTNHISTIGGDTDTPHYTDTLPDTATLPDTTPMLNRIDSTTNINGLTSGKPIHSSIVSINNQTTSILWPTLGGMTTLQLSGESREDGQTTNILGPVLVGVGTLVLLVMISVVVTFVFIRKRRQKADTGSRHPHELHNTCTSTQHNNCETDNRAEDNEGYESLNLKDLAANDNEYEMCGNISSTKDTANI